MKRWYRPKKAAAYLDVNVDHFNKEIRPYLIEIPVGNRGIRFDVLDLDNWADVYKSCHGRSPKKGEQEWLEQNSQDSRLNVGSGKLTKSLTGSAYAKARAKKTMQKQKPTQSNALTQHKKTGT